MQWTAGQDRALVAIRKWLLDDFAPTVFRLDGWAGTGKTTLVEEALSGFSGTVEQVAPTGKAAGVLARRTGRPASTIHSKIYQPKSRARAHIRQMETELETLGPGAARDKLIARIKEESDKASRPMFALREESDLTNAGVVVCDESFMVGFQVGDDMMSFGPRKVLAVGDPFQLPPVMAEPYFQSHPVTAYLDEVTRQGKDSPVVRLATTFREGEVPDFGQYGDSAVIHKREAFPERQCQSDVTVVGYNKTRRKTNTAIRRVKLGNDVGYLPRDGEKLVCLRNDGEVMVVNGMTCTMVSTSNVTQDIVYGIVARDDTSEANVAMLRAHFAEYARPGAIDGVRPWEREGVQEFDFGYAQTCHKLQGSEEEKVFILSEPVGNGPREKFRWLYTAATRARRVVTIAI